METLMFNGGFPAPPLPQDAVPIGPGGRFALFVLLCFLLVAIAYFFFEMCAALMSEEVWQDFRRMELRPWAKRLQQWWRS
jgi:hypothetical protein